MTTSNGAWHGSKAAMRRQRSQLSRRIRRMELRNAALDAALAREIERVRRQLGDDADAFLRAAIEHATKAPP